MGKIFKIEEVPENEQIYLKKDYFGWRVVEPIKREDGSYNWFILLTGGKKNLAMLIFLLILGSCLYMAYNEGLSNYKTVLTHPCNFCEDSKDYQTIKKTNMNNLEDINLSELNLSIGGR